MIVGVDIGGHHIAAALVDRSSDLVPGSYRHLETDRNADADDLLTSWAKLVDEVASISTEPVTGVGIAMPGPFDYRSGTAWFDGNGKFESLYGVDVKGELTRRSDQGPDFRFLNDATAFAVGSVAQEKRGIGRVLAVTLGTGLGSAFLENDVPVIDAGNGEVPPHGCLWHLPFEDGIADDYVSSRWILREAGGLGQAGASVADIAKNARAHGSGREIFQRYGANLGTIVAPWIRSFSVEVIILGGRITGAFDLFSPTLRATLAEQGAEVPILIHENTENAAIIGAAKTFDERFWIEAEPRLPRR